LAAKFFKKDNILFWMISLIPLGTIKKQTILVCFMQIYMVEARRVELLSEGIPTKASTRIVPVF